MALLGRRVGGPLQDLAARPQEAGGGRAGRGAGPAGGRRPGARGRPAGGAGAQAGGRAGPGRARGRPGGRRGPGRAAPARPRRRARPPHGPLGGPPARHLLPPSSGRGGGPPQGPVLLLVRDVPPLLRPRGEARHLPRLREAPALRRRDGLRRPLSAAHPPDRHGVPQGEEQLPDPRSGRRREPLGDRLGGGGAQGGRPQARHARRLPALPQEGRGARPGDRPRPRLPVLAGPPLCEGAPGVVPQAAGRHHPVRRESAQEVPGHLSVRLRDGRLASALGGAEEHRRLLGEARGCASSAWTTPTPRRSPSGSG